MKCISPYNRNIKILTSSFTEHLIIHLCSVINAFIAIIFLLLSYTELKYLKYQIFDIRNSKLQTTQTLITGNMFNLIICDVVL